MQLTSLIPSFNAGELSPYLHLRADLEKYRSGCRTLRNMLITPYGGVRRRPGQEFIYETKNSGKVRLERFQYSVADSYCLEFGAEYLRVFKDGAFVDDGGSPYEIATPYTVDELFDLQIAQVNNFAYIVHPLHHPRLLSRGADDEWTLELVEWVYPPLLDENTVEEFTMTTDFTVNAGAAAWSSSAVAYSAGDRVTYSSKTWVCAANHTSAVGKEPGVGTYNKAIRYGRGTILVPQQLWTESFSDTSAVEGQVIDLTSVADVFDGSHVGAYFELAKEREVGDYEVSFKAISGNDGLKSEPVIIQGGWQFDTFGTWEGTFTLERSKDRGATWEDVKEWSAVDDRNVSEQGTEESRVLMRIRFDNGAGTGAGGDQRGVLSATDGFIRGVVQIATVTDANTATATVIKPVEKMTTSFWSEGAWSDFRGYPRTVTAHEQRLVYGGTDDLPMALWGSVIDDYDNFKRGVEDDDSWVHILAAQEQNTIRWMLSQKALLVGTSGGEWSIAASKNDEVISATNVRARRHASHGSSYQRAHLVNDAAIFIQRGGRKIRELTYSFEQDGYITQDLTLLSDHVTEGGVIQTAYQQQRDSTLWAVTGDGELIGMTYERTQNVVGWHRHTTGVSDSYESVAVIGTTGEEDEVWVSVKRTIDGETKRFIERLKPDQFRAQENNALSELFFFDSGVTATGTDLTELTGLDHLNGETVQVVADGAVLEDRVVSGGTITLGDKETDPEEADTIAAGLAYDSILEPMPLELGLQNGTSAGREKRIHELVIFFHQTNGCQVGSTVDGDFDVIPFRDANMQTDAAIDLYTGPRTVQPRGDYDLRASFVLKQSIPLPMTITAIIPKFNIYGDNI
jgi:hypothetical protein